MDFERRIMVKRKAAESLARSLARTPVGSDAIAIGTATDPYQPAERKFEVTRSILEIFARLGGLNLSITTKSNLITRDLDLLAKINERSRLTVNLSLITLNRRLQRILEPRAPRPALRLRALHELTTAGIRCNVLIMPIIPGITDNEAAIGRIIEMARAAGAAQVWARSLFLKPSAARSFLPFIEREFPHLSARMNDFYGHSTYAPRTYSERMSEIVERLKRKHGFEIADRVVARQPVKPAFQLSFSS
jgi:DNA repair photolyase